MYLADDDHVDLAVRALADGVRIQTVLNDSAAPTKYTYPLGDGVVPILNADGSIDLTVTDEDMTLVFAHIEPAWAYDANGKMVPTHYELVTGGFTQIVNHSAADAYPVVADPTYSVGYGVWMWFNRAETASVAQPGDIAGWVVAACTAAGALLGPGVGVVAGVACVAKAAPIVYQARVAQNSSPQKCLRINIKAFPWGVETSASAYKSSRCK